MMGRSGGRPGGPPYGEGVKMGVTGRSGRSAGRGPPWGASVKIGGVTAFGARMPACGITMCDKRKKWAAGGASGVRVPICGTTVGGKREKCTVVMRHPRLLARGSWRPSFRNWRIMGRKGPTQHFGARVLIRRDSALLGAVSREALCKKGRPTGGLFVHGGDRRGYEKNCAPFALMVEPEMKPASSAARNTTQRAISSGSPRRPTGICGMMRSFSTFSSMARTISVPI